MLSCRAASSGEYLAASSYAAKASESSSSCEVGVQGGQRSGEGGKWCRWPSRVGCHSTAACEDLGAQEWRGPGGWKEGMGWTSRRSMHNGWQRK